MRINDLSNLKRGVDPEYKFDLTPHVYLLRYFPDNVYCAYLAWFLTYQAGLLKTNPKILDIAAGPGTIVFGLSLLLQTLELSQQSHIVYHSLEKQSSFQYESLKVWQKYQQNRQSSHLFSQLQSADFIQDSNFIKNIPDRFFDYIVISHCFLFDARNRHESYQIYKNIFEHKLSENGVIILIVQGRKLFKAYESSLREDQIQEKRILEKFMMDIGLNAVFYQYATSTGQRQYMKDFSDYSRRHCPPRLHLNALARQYLQLNYDSYYSLDDYIILCQPQRNASYKSNHPTEAVVPQRTDKQRVYRC